MALYATGELVILTRFEIISAGCQRPPFLQKDCLPTTILASVRRVIAHPESLIIYAIHSEFVFES